MLPNLADTKYIEIFRFFLICFTCLCFTLTCPAPHTFDIKGGFKFSNIDDFFSLVIKYNIILLNCLLISSSISFLILGLGLGGILGGLFTLMENGSSSGSQGPGSNNFTGGGPGGNNGNGPNPGGNNFHGPADGDGGNNRRNKSFMDIVLDPQTDTDKLADFLQAEYDKILEKKGGGKIPRVSIHRALCLWASPHLAWRDDTVFPSMVLTHIEDELKKENKIGNLYTTNPDFKGKPFKSGELNPELIANIREMRENVPEWRKKMWEDLVKEAKLKPEFQQRRRNS